MKFKLRIASIALLAMASAPAWALQLGQIQVKSALNQPLVAAIPLLPGNLTELEGLTVALASADDFARAGLPLTPADRTLRFRVVTDNNGQKLILVASSQPVGDPYLDFLVQVNTRQGKQLREFVVLLNPVIAAPAPTGQTAPVVSPPPPRPALLPAPARSPPPLAPPEPQPQSSQSKPPTQTRSKPEAPPQPKPQPKPQVPVKPRAPPPPPPPPEPTVAAGRQIPVHRGDTLYGIASDTSQGTDASINQMMLALKSANPQAFFKDNINNLKAGAILRIPTRDEIDKTSIAKANAEVHRQYEAWRAAKPHPATVVEGTAAKAAAITAPQPGAAAPASDHLALVPPTGGESGAGNRPGVAGGTGNETVAGLQQQLHTGRGTLASLTQSNGDLESRVRSLEEIARKSDKLLSLKDATIAELQHKLAAVQSGEPIAAAASTVAGLTAGGSSPAAASAAPLASGADVGAAPATEKSHVSPTAWYERPLAWIVAGLIVLALILIGLLSHRRGRGEAPAAARGPLPDPEDVSASTGTATYAASLQAQLVEDPDNLDTHLALCRLYHAQGDVGQFVAAAEAMHDHVRDPGSLEWHEVAVMGEGLAPGDPLFAAPGASKPDESPGDPYGLEALRRPVAGEVTGGRPTEARSADVVPDDPTDVGTPEDADAGPGMALEHSIAYQPVATAEPVPDAQTGSASAGRSEPEFSDDPIDTKLDLARAYLDMGDPVGARAMLDEVLEEGSQAQKDEAKRLLVETSS